MGQDRAGIGSPILRDYIQKKFIVITVDYGNEAQAVSPHFDKDLHDILKAVYGFKTESLLKDIHLMPKDFRCFFSAGRIPGGNGSCLLGNRQTCCLWYYGIYNEIL